MDLAIAFIYAVGSVICHQLPERSFFLAGSPLPVCARCTGLYLGGLCGIGAWLLSKIARRWRAFSVSGSRALRLVAITALPTVVSVATAVTGVWDGSNLLRAAMAFPLGLTAGAVVASVFTKDLR
jgi:uncharacterized membrane protein